MSSVSRITCFFKDGLHCFLNSMDQYILIWSKNFRLMSSSFLKRLYLLFTEGSLKFSYPKICPPLFIFNGSRFKGLFKQHSPNRGPPKLRFAFYQKSLNLQGLKWISRYLICL